MLEGDIPLLLQPFALQPCISVADETESKVASASEIHGDTSQSQYPPSQYCREISSGPFIYVDKCYKPR
jgi:hypothetical protein